MQQFLIRMPLVFLALCACLTQAHAAEAVNIKLEELAAPAKSAPAPTTPSAASAPEKSAEKKPKPPHEGERIAFDAKRGNCLACHEIGAGKNAGNIGPALIDLQRKYPKEEQLLAYLRDASAQNPRTIMPPYGKHRLLTEEEMKLIAEYLYTLTSAPDK
ncbi:MAG: sulfur oxidation c-type cytochrome SoxX [Pseudomonadota bacterium]